MGPFDIKDAKIIKENAELIHRTVLAVAAEKYIPDLEAVLIQAESNGWVDLVKAIRKILGGERDILQITGLDGEDRAIVSAILEGIKDPSSLPDLTNVIDPAVAGPSMANMIHDAAAGDLEAQKAIEALGEKMAGTNGDFSRIPNTINLMVAGERQEDVLCKDMGAAGTSLIQAILEELKKIRT